MLLAAAAAILAASKTAAARSHSNGSHSYERQGARCHASTATIRKEQRWFCESACSDRMRRMDLISDLAESTEAMSDVACARCRGPLLATACLDGYIQ